MLSSGWLWIAGGLTLAPLLVAGFAVERVARLVLSLPPWQRVLAPGVLALPYALVALARGEFWWGWLLLYALAPVALAGVLARSRTLDEGSARGRVTSFCIDLSLLLLLGLAVDLRWLERAWPAHLAVFGKMLLLDAGVYGFVFVRRLEGVGFDLRLSWLDVRVGVREFAIYTPVALVLGLALGFLHMHALWPSPGQVAGALGFTFLFVALPEELFFRGWMQNLLERRLGRVPALLATAVLFGLSHFNKRTLFFNWQYVVLAAIAGVFYGRAWRANRRVGASTITHTLVDSVWSIWLR